MPPALTRKFWVTSSWDDGTSHDLRLAELLWKYNLPATFYVAKHHQYGSLADGEIRELGRSFELGAHTLNHVVVDSVADVVAENEIKNSKSWIEQVSGQPCRVFCYPRGRFSSQHVRMVKEAGFAGARTVELMSCMTPALISGVAVIPTTIQAFPHQWSAYMKNILRRQHVHNLLTYLHAQGRDWITMASSLLSWISSRGGVFHLWGHAWEIEELGLWHDLEDLFRVVEQYKNMGTYSSNSELCEGVTA